MMLAQSNRKCDGFTMIELIVFIVVIGIASVAILLPLNTASEKSATDSYISTASALAQERMELIIGQRHLVGYTLFIDPCTSGSPPPDCAFTGYTISSTIAVTSIGGDSNYKSITVTVTGLGNATLTSLVGNY